MDKRTKYIYIWRLARFLVQNNKRMSGSELAEHLNRNGFKTSYGSEYAGKRGTYTLIKAVWSWVQNDLNLPEEAEYAAKAFVNANNLYAYEA